MIKRILRFLFKNGLLLLLGLFLGLVIFTPWELVWNNALDKMNKQASMVALQWKEMESASFRGFTLRGVDVRSPQGRYRADAVDIRLGLFTPLKAVIATGPETLNLAMSWGKSLSLDGGVEIGMLLNKPNTAGQVTLLGNIDWETFEAPPVSGRLALGSQMLAWEGKTNLAGLIVESSLEGSILTLETLAIEKPLPVRMQGEIDVNWARITQSKSEFEGGVQIGDKEQRFKKKGSLQQLLNQAGL